MWGPSCLGDGRPGQPGVWDGAVWGEGPPPSFSALPCFRPGGRLTPDLLVRSGSMNQFTAIYSGNGELINHIKYYDGFMGQRVGAISCLAFHPHWVCVPTPGARGTRGGGTGDRGGMRAGGTAAGPAPHHLVPCPRRLRNRILSGHRVSRGHGPQTASKSSTTFLHQAGRRGLHRHEAAHSSSPLGLH